MAKLILATTRNTMDLLRGGHYCPVMDGKRCLLYTQAYASDLAALSWRLESVLNHNDDHAVVRAAGALMFVPEIERKIEEGNERWLYSGRLRAEIGDIIVVLPDERSIPRGRRTMPAQDFLIANKAVPAKDYLIANKVWAFHVGGEMQDDIFTVVEHLGWNTYQIPVSRDVGSVKEQHPHMVLTVYDVIRARESLDGAKSWNGLFMKYRSEMRLSELNFDRLSSVTTEEVLRHKFTSMGIHTEHYTHQTKAFAAKFVLHNDLF